MRESTFTLRKADKVFIFASVIFIFISLFIPLWQIGVNHSLGMKIRADEKYLAELSKEEQKVRFMLAEERGDDDLFLAVLNERKIASAQVN